ncbi:MAG TPA: phytanoyl-CoA dioxygenase family protein [Candidatus Acidoferrales bacterium]
MTSPGNLTSARPPFLLSALRKQPHFYSAICKARMIYSRQIAGAAMREIFRRNRDLLAPTNFEEQQVSALRKHGYALISDFFPQDLIDSIYRKADSMFWNLQIDTKRAYTVQSKERQSLEGLSYQELAASEKMIALRDPLVNIPEVLAVAFHESILKIAANLLGYIPPLYRVTVVRDFPHNRPLHSSNFHKDNDESDSLQIFIYLVDIDDTRGPLVYVPGSNHYDVRSCRPRLSRDLGIAGHDGRLSDEEVERIYPRNSWATLRTKRGSIAAIHGNGIHKGPAWGVPGSPLNLPRTAIKLDLHGHKTGVVRNLKENRIRRSDFERMTQLQKLFAHCELVDETLPF